MKTKYIAIALIAAMFSTNVDAQQKLTKEQILNMSIEQLSELELDVLMDAVETLGVSSVDELFAMIMNKNVSSASKKEENSFTSPLSSTVITKEEMRTYGISTLEEAFRLIPGMIVQEKSNGVYDIEMRGLNNIPDNLMFLYTENQNILLMVDGRICHNYATGSPTFENLPLGIEDIERIEVVRGATSALYGPNAVNGVVNIITQKPDYGSKAISGSFQVGNRTAVGEVALRKKISDKFAMGVTANVQNRRRDTDKFYLMPLDGVNNKGNNRHYVVADKSLTGQTFTDEQIDALIANGSLRDVTNGANLTTSELNNLNYMMENTLYRTSQYHFDYNKGYEHPRMSRENFGINGYLTFTPASDVRINVTGGFQNSKALSTPVGNEDIALKVRTSKTGYIATDSYIKDLHVLLNYSLGPQDYAHGNEGFYVHSNILNAEANYDFHFGNLTVRPSVAYQYVYYKDFDNGYDEVDGKELCGFFGYYSKGNYDATIKDFAPSLRLDYKNNGLRLIGAFREDKTNMPDKWAPTWQFAANYEINDRNFIRAVYGHSRRSVTIANSSSMYNWERKGMYHPNEIQFYGNPDADLTEIDNYELGYRWKPLNNLLIDAEAFYSYSDKFGSLGSDHSLIYIQDKDLSSMLGTFSGLIGQALAQAEASGQPLDVMSMLNSAMPYVAQLAGMMHTKAYIKYELLPYEVHQMGVSMNVDWIISPKLIAKFNANVQKTTIDNYYPYSQSDAISSQLASAIGQTQSSLMNFDDLNNNLLVELMMTGISTAGPEGLMSYLGDAQHFAPINDYRAEYEKDPVAFLQATHAAYLAGQAYQSAGKPAANNPIALYYGTKYNIQYDESNGQYYFGGTGFTHEPARNGYKHKATPSVYGMMGLIYKPTNKLEVSAFANLMSKRTYVIQYNHMGEKLAPRCTVNMKIGYKPVENCEVFFNGRNLFNNEKREFPFADKIGGIYTVGVNFGF